MIKFIMISIIYFASLFTLLHLIPDDQPQLLHDLALDQVEFNQSLPEIDSLRSLEVKNSLT